MSSVRNIVQGLVDGNGGSAERATRIKRNIKRAINTLPKQNKTVAFDQVRSEPKIKAHDRVNRQKLLGQHRKIAIEDASLSDLGWEKEADPNVVSDTETAPKPSHTQPPLIGREEYKALVAERDRLRAAR